MLPTPVDKRFLVILAVCTAIGAGAASVVGAWAMREYQARQYADSYDASGNFETYSDASTCNVIGIQVHGTIVASRADIPLIDTQQIQQSDGTSRLVAPNYTVANEVEDTLRSIAKDDTVKAVLVDVDSPGGGVVSGQEIANAVRKSGKYSVAVIHNIGASAGYLSAAAANKVYAGRDSEVGSIGVTASFLTQHEKNKKDGIEYEQLSSGIYKDMYSADKPLTEDEKKLIMRDVNRSRDHFVELVAQYRNMSVADVDKLADGSTMLGEAALENKLIDAVGTTWEAVDHIEKQIGEPVSICWQ